MIVTLMVAGDLLLLGLGLVGVLLTQLFLVLGPALVLACGATAPASGFLRLRNTSLANLPAALVLGAASAVLLNALYALEFRLWPPAPETLGFATVLEDQAKAAPWLALAALVVSPALAEEVLFRGVLLDRLRRRYAASLALGLQALLFALFHRDPHRLLPMLLLGLLLGHLAQAARSLAAPMAAHFAHNLVVLRGGDWLQEAASSGLLVATAAVVLGVVLGCERLIRRREDEKQFT